MIENLVCPRGRRLGDRFSTSSKTAGGGEVENLPRSRRLRRVGRFSTLPKIICCGEAENLLCTSDGTAAEDYKSTSPSVQVTFVAGV